MLHEGHCGCSANQDHLQSVGSSVASTAAEPTVKVKEAMWKQKAVRLKSYICTLEQRKHGIVDVPVVVTINVTFHHAEASFVFIITPEPGPTMTAERDLYVKSALEQAVRSTLKMRLEQVSTREDRSAVLTEIRGNLAHALAYAPAQGDPVQDLGFRASFAAVCDAEIARLEAGGTGARPYGSGEL
jgi:hypothetical protein